MNGLLVLDKPAGMTSHDVVSVLRRATGEKSIGHLGTLDPMATGVLPLLMGRCTRLAQFFGQAQKSYTGTMRFGFATDSYDGEGTATSEPLPLTKSLDELCELATKFHGVMEQMPPAYSAKKINGVPAYKLARAGKPVPVKTATIEILNFELTALQSDTATFAMSVSAGGYVRSVAHELGALAGCGAHLASLRRTQAGVFTLADAITLDEMKLLSTKGTLQQRMPHLRTLLPEIPAVTVDAETAGRIRNGMAVNVPEYSTSERVKIFTNMTDLLAIGKRIAGTLVHPEIVLV
ncbi:MAG: tRNA pseudouridine(55) synthase TruB [Acidobacteriaceae bacterium]|jgi:tRNA pseudouridine55 synthase|nr:tRNA pseudouridine(55) synthase TruB [Acidobacteriaceae bacterium]